MTTQDFITELFCKIADQMKDVPKHTQASLWPGELVTIGMLNAIKGVGNRAFYRWLTRDFRPLFPNLPDRTRLFRLFKAHQDWTDYFLVSPTLLGVIDSYGIELIHPIREGRSNQQMGKKGRSNHRWIVGGKLCLVLNHLGLVSAWECATANVHDTSFQPLIERFEDQMLILGDLGFHAREGDPSNLKLCERGQWNERMMDDGGNGVLHAHLGLSFQEGNASCLGLLSSQIRFHHGCIQSFGPMGRSQAR